MRLASCSDVISRERPHNMRCKRMIRVIAAVIIGIGSFEALKASGSEEPPAINPFGSASAEREDAIPGFVELSDGKVFVGKIYTTRDKRLKIFDSTIQRQREIPLDRVKQIECIVVSERMEKEWRFKETAADVKEYTGRSYPAREYRHRITLADGRTIEGPISEVVYLMPQLDEKAARGSRGPYVEPQRFILYKTHKGPIGSDLKSLVYVKAVKLGEEAFAEGLKKAARRTPTQSVPQETSEATTSGRQ